MSLRTKLALLLVAAVVPVVALFSGFRYFAERNAMRERIVNRVTTRHVSRAQRRCHRRPESFHIDRHRVEVFAYRTDLASANSTAPTFPDKLADRIGEDEGPFTSWQVDIEGAVGATALEARESNGPCSVFLFLWSRGFGPPPMAIVRRVLVQSAVAAVILLGMGLLVAGPLVGRIRRLTDEVREAGDRNYHVDAEADAGDELGDLARAFNQAGDDIRETIDELEARDAALRDYVANTTHDLAVPVTVLQHRLTKLRRQLDEEGAVSDELLESAIEETQYVSSMISNVGTVARLEAGDREIACHDIDLRDVVERIGARFQQIAEQKDLDFNWAVPDRAVEVEADSTLVEQAVGNCVQNAIQYNVEGGHVGLVLDRTPDGGFELRIVDDGPGVPDDVLDRLTEREFRDDQARSRRPSGQGFGLSIARQVVDAHGWQIAFENRDTGGLEVVIKAARSS